MKDENRLGILISFQCHNDTIDPEYFPTTLKQPICFRQSTSNYNKDPNLFEILNICIETSCLFLASFFLTFYRIGFFIIQEEWLILRRRRKRHPQNIIVSMSVGSCAMLVVLNSSPKLQGTNQGTTRYPCTKIWLLSAKVRSYSYPQSNFYVFMARNYLCE